MGWFKKSRKLDPKLPETLSLTAEHVVKAAAHRQESSLEDISSELQHRLKMELSGIMSEVVDTALDNTRAETEQMLRNELITMLEDRLDQLVEQAIKKHLTKPRDDQE